VLECVPNVAEGRATRVLDALAHACGGSLLDVHADVDHHRSVFTLAGPGARDAEPAVRALARAVAQHVDLTKHAGVHPRRGALDVVPFVALDGSRASDAVDAAHAFASWAAAELEVPVFLYGDADRAGRSLPELRRDAFTARPPDAGPGAPHPRLGAIAVGARPVLVAVNCDLATGDVTIARAIARSVRERDGGLPGVRALGLWLGSRGHAQVSMNLVDLAATGIQRAAETVEELARARGTDVARVELVGLAPESEVARLDDSFRARSGIGPEQTVEARLRARAESGQPSSSNCWTLAP
jgi:glutamate formiminotransferase / 5-formyltetrahydrofolate cyclo-ligase